MRLRPAAPPARAGGDDGRPPSGAAAPSRENRLVMIALGVISPVVVALGFLLTDLADPFPWRTAILLVALSAGTRAFGIALPGKWFTSHVAASGAVAVVALGWPAGATAAALGAFAGDFVWRRLPARRAADLAAHLATAASVGGVVYAMAGGAHGAAALETSNLGRLAMVLLLVPIIANATFYLQMRLSTSVQLVDPQLTARWELAVNAIGVLLASGGLVVLLLPVSAAARAGLALGWIASALLSHWLTRRGVQAESLLLAQRLTRAIGARTEFAQAFEDIKALTGTLVPWGHMGMAKYDEARREFVILVETSTHATPGVRFSANSGLSRFAMERGEPVTDRDAPPESRVNHRGSEILVPLRYGGRLVGLWSVRHDAEEMYWRYDAELLGHLASPLALALSLDAVVRPVLDASEETAQQVLSITASTTQLHATSELAAANARRMAGTVKLLADTLATGADQAEAARRIAESSATRGEETRESGEQMVAAARSVLEETARAMQRLTEAAAVVQEGTEQVSRLQSISETVERFRRSITSLADQSGLLALNAAIEAARVGEHGRGFAVVANEMRQLADGSAREAEGVERSVLEIRSTLESTIELMQRTHVEVLTVAGTSGALVSELDRIVRAAEDVAATGQSIASTARETAQQSSAMAQALARAQVDAERASAETVSVADTSAEQGISLEALNRAATELGAMARQLAMTVAAVRAG